MHRLLLFLLVGIALSTSCTSPSEDHAMTEIANFYGGRVEFKKGANFSTKADDLSGKFLEIDLTSPGISQHFSDLQLPASNCAYLAYHSLTPTESDRYDYYKVTVIDSTSSHNYTFKASELAQASHAYQLAINTLAGLQRHEYLTVANACNSVAFNGLSSDSLLANITRISHYLLPLESYTLQGFEDETIKIDRQRFPLTAVVATIPNSEHRPPHQLTILLNANAKSSDRFLYGIHVKN